MTRFRVWVKMQFWKCSKYSRIPDMPGLCICKHYTSFWIQSSEYVSPSPRASCACISSYFKDELKLIRIPKTNKLLINFFLTTLTLEHWGTYLSYWKFFTLPFNENTNFNFHSKLWHNSKQAETVPTYSSLWTARFSDIKLDIFCAVILAKSCYKWWKLRFEKKIHLIEDYSFKYLGSEEIRCSSNVFFPEHRSHFS